MSVSKSTQVLSKFYFHDTPGGGGGGGGGDKRAPILLKFGI